MAIRLAPIGISLISLQLWRYSSIGPPRCMKYLFEKAMQVMVSYLFQQSENSNKIFATLPIFLLKLGVVTRERIVRIYFSLRALSERGMLVCLWMPLACVYVHTFAIHLHAKWEICEGSCFCCRCCCWTCGTNFVLLYSAILVEFHYCSCRITLESNPGCQVHHPHTLQACVGSLVFTLKRTEENM